MLCRYQMWGETNGTSAEQYDCGRWHGQTGGHDRPVCHLLLPCSFRGRLYGRPVRVSALWQLGYLQSPGLQDAVQTAASPRPSSQGRAGSSQKEEGAQSSTVLQLEEEAVSCCSALSTLKKWIIGLTSLEDPQLQNSNIVTFPSSSKAFCCTRA